MTVENGSSPALHSVFDIEKSYITTLRAHSAARLAAIGDVMRTIGLTLLLPSSSPLAGDGRCAKLCRTSSTRSAAAREMGPVNGRSHAWRQPRSNPNSRNYRCEATLPLCRA